MKVFAGIVFFLMAIAAFLWVGIYWALVGGVIDAIHAFQADPINVNQAVWGIARAVFFETFGAMAALIPGLISFALFGWWFFKKD